MNYEYYKYKLLDNDFDKLLEKNIKDYGYYVKNKFVLGKKKQAKIYKKKKQHAVAKLGSYIMYVEADELTDKNLDLLVNFCLPASNSYEISKAVSYSNVFLVYIILKVEKVNDSLLNFVKYGATTPYSIGMKCYGKLQVPIVFDNNKNEVLVGTYPNYFYNKMIFYKNAIEEIKNFFEHYYLINNFDEEGLKPIICKNKRKFKEGLYPVLRIYTKYSESVQKNYYSLIDILIVYCLCISIILMIRTRFRKPLFIIVSLIFSLCMIYKDFRKKRERILKYNEIKLELNNCNYLKFFDNYLIGNDYIKLNNNLYKLNKVVFYFVKNNIQIKYINKYYNYYIILDEDNTEDLTKVESLDNVLVFKYNNGFLKILKGNNYKLLKQFLKIIDGIYST